MPLPHEPKPRIYLAAPLFAQQERLWNRLLAERLEALVPCSVALPQEIQPGEQPDEAEQFPALFRRCLEGVEECDVLVALLDGPDADSGAAFEMGYAHALGKPIIGVRTDYRPQHDHGTNLMLARACAAMVHLPALDADLDALAEAIGLELRRLLPLG